MRRLITSLLAGAALAVCFTAATPQKADAQVVIRSGRNWDRSGYWHNYWRWYDRRYRPYYTSRYYYSSPSYYYGSPYYYGYRGGLGYPAWGYRGGVQVGGVGVYWR